MYRLFALCFFLLAALLLLADDSAAPADSAWKGKPASKWSDEDVVQVLANSPWVKYVRPEHIRDLSAFERRDGGDMQAGIGKGLGLEALVGIFGGPKMTEAIARAHAKVPADVVVVRWESARPMRIAEQRAGVTPVHLTDDDHYAIAVYGIPMPPGLNMANVLKGISFIKREHQKDFKPSRVEILRQPENTATIVYFFPRTVEITRKDGWITFVAQIGRLFVAQNFSTEEMQFQGALEL
jgi:hypothetical protein